MCFIRIPSGGNVVKPRRLPKNYDYKLLYDEKKSKNDPIMLLL